MTIGKKKLEFVVVTLPIFLEILAISSMVSTECVCFWGGGGVSAYAHSIFLPTNTLKIPFMRYFR